MTISSTAVRKQYSGNDIATEFAFPYNFNDDGDLIVILTDADGVDTTQTITTDYTLTGAGVEGGGTVTMLTAPATGETLTIYRQVDLTQETDLSNQGAYFLETLEESLDYLTMIAQQIQEKTERSLVLGLSSAFSDIEVPDPESGKIMQWQADDTLANIALASIGTLALPVSLANGGTAATDAATARTNLGAAASGANSDITSIAGLTTDLAVEHGGTGSGTAAGARSNLSAQEDVITTRGDVIIGDASGDAERLGVGAVGQVLTSDGTDVAWGDVSATPGDASISQAKLKTSIGSVSVTNTVYDTAVLPGGEYGFFIQQKVSGGAGASRLYEAAGNTVYATRIVMKNSTGGQTTYAQQRYVTSSGEVFWIFILRDKTAKNILSVWQGPDHPCFGNSGKPLLVPFPFADVIYNEETESYFKRDQEVEIVVCNPSKDQVLKMQEMLDSNNDGVPDRDMIEVIMDEYVIDEDSAPQWPDTAVTVGLPPDYMLDYSKPLQTIKKVIPRPVGVLCKTLVLK